MTVWLKARPAPARSHAFAGAFAAMAGMLYGSFFGTLVDPAGPLSSNIEGSVLTAVIGLAFFSALEGLVASIRLAGVGDRSGRA